MLSRVTIDPNVCHGQACVKGTRIPVYQIVRMLANGDTIDGLLEDYPSLSREDILACLEYAALLAEEQVAPIEKLGSWPCASYWTRTYRQSQRNTCGLSATML